MRWLIGLFAGWLPFIIGAIYAATLPSPFPGADRLWIACGAIIAAHNSYLLGRLVERAKLLLSKPATPPPAEGKA